VADMDPLARLTAIEAITALKARYLRLVDDKQWSELPALFTDDAHFEFPGLGTFDEPGRCIEALKAVFTGTTSVHHGHMPEITVTGEDTATGVWSLHDVVVRLEGSGGLPGYPEQFRAGHRGYARLFQEYRRCHDGWRIAAFRVERIRLEPLRPA
jgi:hypothetical protein